MPGMRQAPGGPQRPAPPKVPEQKQGPPPLPPVPPEFQAEPVFRLDAAGLIALLRDPSSTVFQKAKACQRLAVVGGKDAVPALAALLTDEKLSHYARYGLEPNPDPAADQALRAALPKLSGPLLVGVINSIGWRRDAGAVPQLGKLIYSRDGEVAAAAAAALGRISGAQAARMLREALGRTKGSVRAAVARASLVCAEGLLAQGERSAGLDLYDRLSRPDIPLVVRLAAMHSMIAAEISLQRPR